MIRLIIRKTAVGGGSGALLLPLLARAESECELNGQPIDCAELADKAMPFVGLGLGMLAFVMLLGFICFIFWLWMLIHAATKPIENKVLWIVLMIIIGVPVSIVYFFVVKRKIDSQAAVPAPAQVPPAGPTPLAQ